MTHTDSAQTSIEIMSVVDEGLGHSSHVVPLGDGSVLIVDPARFPLSQRRMAAERGWEIAWTADTHSHADYISGSPELAADGATFLAPAGAALEHPHHPVEPGQEIELAGRFVLRAIATPGHTPEHLAYLLLDDGTPAALFSGGSLLVGTVGRTDLLGDGSREDLAAQLYRALRDEILTLPDDLPVYPTHGAGSFCSPPATLQRTTTIGRERATNPLLQTNSEQEFVELLVDRMGTFPAYFQLLPERNRHVVRTYSEIPSLPRLTAPQVAEEVARGAVLVDTRPIAAVAAGYPAGALSNALRPVFASWLGWLVNLDTPLVFLVGEDQDRSELVRQCLIIGHERLLGELDGGIDAWADARYPINAIPLVGVAALASNVIDVRQAVEYDAGHVPGARNVELGALAEAEIPEQLMTLMCGHGERAMTGATLLAHRGRSGMTVLVGGPEDWAANTGRDLTAGPAQG